MQVQYLAAQAHLDFTYECDRYLHAFVSEGVSRLGREKLLDDERAILVAGQSLELFVRGMIEYAQRQGWSELPESSFFAAKKFLCPIWPFC